MSKARYVPGFGQPGLLSDNADAKAGRQAEDAAGDIAPVHAPVAAKPHADTRCGYCKENGFQAPNLCEDCRGDQIAEIIAQVHEELEGGASADRIKQIANENPQFSAEILGFTAEWFVDVGGKLADDLARAAISKAEAI